MATKKKPSKHTKQLKKAKKLEATKTLTGCTSGAHFQTGIITSRP